MELNLKPFFVASKKRSRDSIHSLATCICLLHIFEVKKLESIFRALDTTGDGAPVDILIGN